MSALRGQEILIPTWCKRVYIEYRSDESPSSCACRTHYEYRWAEIHIYPSWVETEKKVQREHLRHELLHVLFCPLVDYVRDVLDTFCKEDIPQNQILYKLLTDHIEMIVQDATYLGNKING